MTIRTYLSIPHGREAAFVGDMQGTRTAAWSFDAARVAHSSQWDRNAARGGY